MRDRISWACDVETEDGITVPCNLVAKMHEDDAQGGIHVWAEIESCEASECVRWCCCCGGEPRHMRLCEECTRGECDEFLICKGESLLSKIERRELARLVQFAEDEAVREHTSYRKSLAGTR